MKTSALIFIGIKGSVVALQRDTGQQVWVTHLKGSDFVNVVLHDGKLFASCCGEVFCLDPATGEGLWHNRLKGFGTGLATMALPEQPGTGMPPVLFEQHRRDQEASAAAASSSAAT